MKKTILLFVILITSLKSNAQIIPDSARSVGLVTYLTTIKYFGETKMISLIENSKYLSEAEKSANFRARYNMLRYQTDALINQLSADLVFHNKLKYYRKLNNYVKGKKTSLPKKYSSYVKMIDAIDASYMALLMSDYSSKNGFSFADIDLLGIAEFGHTIITDARDARATKIESLIAIIAENKLSAIDSLIKKDN